MTEEWRDVPGYEGLYQISIDTKEGRCRRLYRNGKIKVLSNRPDKNWGRIYWGLCKDGKESVQQSARWIALTYQELVENEWFEGAEIDHKDTDRLNNRPSNLRWVDRSGQMNNPLTRKHNSAALTNRRDMSKVVSQFKLDGTYVATYPSVREAQRKTGIQRASIDKCCSGKGYYKTAGGFVWKYAE